MSCSLRREAQAPVETTATNEKAKSRDGDALLIRTPLPEPEDPHPDGPLDGDNKTK
jgi:hypothetical protein